MTISGNAAESFLLFTAAAEVPIEDPQSSLVCPGDTDEDGDGYSANQGDCDDDDASIHPGATDSCGDGIDQDCSGEDCPSPETPAPIDNDGDGYTAGSDCNDNDASIHPGATDTCGDGIDQDCNGGDCPPPEPPEPIDDDGDGYTAGSDCNDNDASIHPGATEICNDGIDQDCSGADCTSSLLPPPNMRIIDPDFSMFFDDDGDGYSEYQGDCNDTNASIYPGATENLRRRDRSGTATDMISFAGWIPSSLKPPSGINLLGFGD